MKDPLNASFTARDIPIIYSAPMVRALIDDNKHMTRRLAWRPCKICGGKSGTCRGPHKPSPWQKAEVEDRLWVRENLKYVGSGSWRYSADDKSVTMTQGDPRIPTMIAWAHHQERGSVPSIHMPRWASRLTLIVTATKIERVQDITMEDMIAEGLSFRPVGKAEHTMAAALRVCDELTPKWRDLWIKLHGQESWDANPEVVALSFKVHHCNIDKMKEAA